MRPRACPRAFRMSRSAAGWPAIRSGGEEQRYAIRDRCPVRLIDLNPRWIASLWDALNGIRFGITFECPHCRDIRLAVFFDPPFGQMEKLPLALWADPRNTMKNIWKRSGETMETLTLVPSIN